MGNKIPNEILPANLADHRAVKAWRQLSPEGFEPQQIEILKLKHKSAVYRLIGPGNGESPVVAKRCRAATACLERLLYEQLHSQLPLPTLRCFGFVPEGEGNFGWLFLEDAGPNKYSPANEEHRLLAGRWLGALHSLSLPENLRTALPDRGPDHYLRLLNESRAKLRYYFDHPALPADVVEMLRRLEAQCDVLQEHWAELEEFWKGVPRRLVHGDFVTKNLRLGSGANGPTLLVYDFEMAGWGIPASDLAQFIGKCVSPDLETYRAAVKQDSSSLNMSDLRQMAAYGNLLRLVDKISWEALAMDGETFDFVIRPISTMKLYEPQMTASLRAVNW